MSTTRAIIVHALLATQALAAPAGGGGTAEVTTDRALVVGGPAVDNSYERVVIFKPDIAGSGSAILNLQTAPDVNQVVAVLTGVIALEIEWPATADGILEIKPDVTEPWLAFLKDVTDVLQLQPGTKVRLEAVKAGDYVVGAGARTLRFDNLGTILTSPTVTVLGTVS